MQAAQSTNAWIITSGCNMGVMKAVGEAVAVGQTYTWDKTGMTPTLRCIGIAPWGYVENRTSLESVSEFGLIWSIAPWGYVENRTSLESVSEFGLIWSITPMISSSITQTFNLLFLTSRTVLALSIAMAASITNTIFCSTIDPQHYSLALLVRLIRPVI